VSLSSGINQLGVRERERREGEEKRDTEIGKEQIE